MRPKTNDKDRRRFQRSFAKPSGVQGFFDIFERWNRKECYVATVTKREIPDGVEVRYNNYTSSNTRGSEGRRFDRDNRNFRPRGRR